MSTFNSQNLFSSGPHAFHVGGVSQRHATHEIPGADGVRVTTLGKTGREIHQAGLLLADDLAQLQSQMAAIEAAMNGKPATLVDDLGREHANVVMLDFKPSPIRRIGVRYAMRYTVRYVQTSP